jgi:hypothetical protein
VNISRSGAIRLWPPILGSGALGIISLYLTIKATTGLVPIGYRGALLSSLLHATVYVTHNLLNVLVQIANKMGLKKSYNNDRLRATLN